MLHTWKKQSEADEELEDAWQRIDLMGRSSPTKSFPLPSFPGCGELDSQMGTFNGFTEDQDPENQDPENHVGSVGPV